MSGRKCFRVSNIPNTWKSGDLVNALRLADNSLRNWQVPLEQISIFPCSTTSKTQTALLNLLDCPEFFKNPQFAKGLLVTTHGQVRLMIDTHFNGITPLGFPSNSSRIDADVIAVTGLAGNAFGSWKHRTSGKMWLLDFLPQQFQNIRVFTFGYNSSLTEGVNNDFSTMMDYESSLLCAVESVRRTADEKKRPLVLLGHSMGGIVVVGSLLQANKSSRFKHIFDSTAGVFFFGTPHGGLNVEDCLEILEDYSATTSTRYELVKQLAVGSAFLRAQNDSMKKLWPAKPRPEIVSFYETLLTPRPVKTAKGWVAGSEKVKRLPPNSATLVGSDVERRIPVAVDADHSNMVKFDSHNDRTYLTFVRHLEAVLKEYSPNGRR